MRVGLSLFIPLLIGATGHAQARPSTCAYSSPPLEQPAPVLLGWPDLAHQALPSGVRRELRVHQDVAITVPDHSMRIVDHGQRVTGEVLISWPGVDFDHVTGGDPGCLEWHAAEAQQLKDGVLKSLGTYLRCGPVEVRARIEGCQVLFNGDPGWAKLLHRTDSLGIWVLKSAGPERLGLDGVDVTVELRDQAGYRRFRSHSPTAGGSPGEREMAALSNLLEEALSAAHSQLGER